MKTALTILIIIYGFGYYYLIDIQKWVGQFSLQQIGATVSIGAMILYLVVSTSIIAVRTYRAMREAIKRNR